LHAAGGFSSPQQKSSKCCEGTGRGVIHSLGIFYQSFITRPYLAVTQVAELNTGHRAYAGPMVLLVFVGIYILCALSYHPT
jgi:hypothetical protein